MATCIYCRKTASSEQFNREHVLSDAFGRYDEDAPVLHDAVCSDCNRYFGNKLEVFFNRGSVEGFERFNAGLKSKDQVDEIHKGRIVARLAESEFKGALLTFKAGPTSTDFLLDIPSQAGFLKIGLGEDREYFLLDELAELEKFPKERYNLKGSAGILYVTNTQEDEKLLMDFLKRFEIKFEKKVAMEQLQKRPLWTEVSIKFDDIARRTIAKFALNYATHVKGVEYVLRPDFDPIRNYVRYGEQPDFPAVTIAKDPILAQDTRRWKQTRNHLFVLETSMNFSSLICKVSLFNHATYQVLLCPRLSGILMKVSSGTSFDYQNHRVTSLSGAPITAMRLPTP